MPSFVELQEKYKNNFIILGVLFDKNISKEELTDFMKKYNMNFPVTVGEENFTLAKAFDDVKMIPESFLYTKDGIFIEKFVGEISKEKLEKYIKDNLFLRIHYYFYKITLRNKLFCNRFYIIFCKRINYR